VHSKCEVLLQCLTLYPNSLYNSNKIYATVLETQQERDTIKAYHKNIDLFIFSVTCTMEISPIFEVGWRFTYIKPYV